MPTISMFYGIVIRMFFSDHNPPHFHAYYQDFDAAFDLDGSLIAGSLPSKQTKLVVAWCALHREELEANWRLSQEDGTVYKIEPLR